MDPVLLLNLLTTKVNFISLYSTFLSVTNRNFICMRTQDKRKNEGAFQPTQKPFMQLRLLVQRHFIIDCVYTKRGQRVLPNIKLGLFSSWRTSTYPPGLSWQQRAPIETRSSSTWTSFGRHLRKASRNPRAFAPKTEWAP